MPTHLLRRRTRLLAFGLGCGLALLAPPPFVRPRALAQGDLNVRVNPALFQELRYRMIGPSRGGRVTATVGVRSQPGTFYMGATGGGVWKTTDFGVTWTPQSDGALETGSIGAIDVAESDPNIVYVGTGSAAIRSNVIQGRGVYKSIDAGRTWTFVGLREAGQIGGVLVHPRNPNLVYVAALGQAFGPGPERGVFRTRDGGKTWQKVLFVNDGTGVVSLAMNPANPDEIYAGAWRGERRPWTIISGAQASEGAGLYKTTDGGETWSKLTTGLPQGLVGKLDIDVARSNPRVVYVLLEAPGAERGVYRSDDSGRRFQQVSSEPNLIRRPFYYTYINVDPRNENIVWVNNESLFRSTDGGRTWRTVSTPHGDNHGMWLHPDNPDLMIQTNDGGANVSQNGGRTWSTQFNQPTAELYQVETDNQFPYRVYGAQQDTGAPVILPSLPPTSGSYPDPIQFWVMGPGCETGPVKPKPDNPNVIYGVCKGEFYRMNQTTGQEQGYWVYPQQRYGHAARDMRYRFQRVSPFEISPHNPRIIYHGSQYLHRTMDEGVTWETISPDLTARRPDVQGLSGEPITRDITGEEVYSTIYAIKESRLEAGVVWVGSNDGPVHVTRDGGKTWKNVTPPTLLAGGRVQNIETSPHRRGSAYIATYRYLLNDWQPFIYKTEDYGATWTRLTDGKNGIPADYPTRVVREDPDREGLLYAGTEFGMFISFDNGQHWQKFQQNLPATPVTDIKIFRKDLVLSTMGRSFWIMDNLMPLHQIALSGTTSADARTPAARQLMSGLASLLGRVRQSVSAPAFAFAQQRPAPPVDVERPAPPRAGQTAPPPVAPRAVRPAAPRPTPTVLPQTPADGTARAFLYQPREAYRMRYASTGALPSDPQYPPPGAHIDYYFGAEPTGEIKLEILDAAGAVIRTISNEGAGETPRLATSPGMHRFVWDMRHEGAWDANPQRAGLNGPLAAPGRYRVRLSAGAWNDARTLEVRVDPRIAADGVTQADLVAVRDLQLKIRDAISEARRAVTRIANARNRLKGFAAPDPVRLRQLDDLEAKIVTAGGPYPQQMLIDQFSNVSRMIGQADQKLPRDAVARYQDLMKEWAAIQADIEAASR